jgi:hypothetical protein
MAVVGSVRFPLRFRLLLSGIYHYIISIYHIRKFYDAAKLEGVADHSYYVWKRNSDEDISFHAAKLMDELITMLKMEQRGSA